MSDVELKSRAIELLINQLGEVEAERFLSLINKETFDYSEWRKKLLIDLDVKTVSSLAMKYRATQK
jgi:hypothetical protein